MSIFKNAKLTPMTKASILLAMDKTENSFQNPQHHLD